ncbi:MAG: hypothetical protein U1D00_23175, partial [Mycobacterium sp.]|nr:hypothetical protein [Mycobacterium sp.]
MTADDGADLGALAGVRVAASESIGDAAITALCSAGAVTTTPAEADRDAAVTTEPPPDPASGVVVVPTAAAGVGRRTYVAAPHLDTANRVLTVLASAAAQRW